MSVRKTVTTAALGLGVLVGSAGMASALGSGPTSPTTAAADGRDETQDPVLDSSIQVPDDQEVSEADEAAALASLARISSDEATAAALAANPGATASGADLGNENGSVVYEVQLTDASGAALEVKVDAGNGAVLAQEADDGSEVDGEAEGDDDGAAADDESDDDGPGATEVTPAG